MSRRAHSNRRSYPRFSPAEYERRTRRVRALLDDRDLDALLVYADGGFESHGVAYLSNYRPSFATYLVAFADPDDPTTLLVGLNNHLQYAAERSVVGDLRTLLPDPARRVAARLDEGGAARVGVAGYDARYDVGLPHAHRRTLDRRFDLVDLTVPYARLVAKRSEAELARVRRAATHLDSAMAALERAIEPGRPERELVAALRRADEDDGRGGDVADGGGGDTEPPSVSTTFLSTAPMAGADPGEPLPWKHRPADRTVGVGDVVTTEVSATYRGYSAQIHRPYAVGDSPTATYRDLHAVVESALDAVLDVLGPGATTDDVADALVPVRDSRFRGYDVALHGYGGWYGPPHVGSPAADYWPGIDDPATEGWTFEPGEVLVVQPNAVTADERHGLQLGTTVVVTDEGIEPLQDYPRRFVEV